MDVVGDLGLVVAITITVGVCWYEVSYRINQARERARRASPADRSTAGATAARR